MSPFRGQLSGKQMPAITYVTVVPKLKRKGAREFILRSSGDQAQRHAQGDSLGTI